MTSPSVSEPLNADPGLSLATASERLIQRFGGIRPMANKLEVPVTTVQGWKKRGVIPATRLADLRAAAQRHGIKLEEDELEAVSRADDRSGADRPADKAMDRGTGGAVDRAMAAEPDSGPAELPGETGLPPFELSTPSHPLLSDDLAPLPPRFAAAQAALGAATGTRPVASTAAGLAIAAALVALVAAGVSVLEPLWTPAAPGSVPSAAADRRLGELEGRITRVAQDQETHATTLGKQLGTLDSRVAAVEKAVPALERKLAAQGAGSPTIAILLAATQLRTALAGSGPFNNELAALRLTGYADPEVRPNLDLLTNRAAAGISSEAWLIGRFSSVVAPNILRAATLGDPLGRVGDEMLGWFATLAPPLYRLTGATQGNSPRAIADRAAAWMAAGDFARAVEQLGELSGPPAEVAAPWLAEARARVTADRLRLQLGQTVVTLAPGGVPPAR